MMADNVKGGMGWAVAAGVLMGGVADPCEAGVAGAGGPARTGEVVRYAAFGAKGDGMADDFDAIVAAHEHANRTGLPVRAEDGATYLIGGGARTAEIRTDTDIGTASFRIDDTRVAPGDRGRSIFCVRSAQPAFRPEGVGPLKRGQANLGVRLPSRSVVVLGDANVRHFIRRGLNKNNGDAKLDVVLVEADGAIDPATPLFWDFDAVTDVRAYPVDDKPLTVRGGRFTTVANQAKSDYTYYGRGIQVERSNVLIEGIEHRIVGEGEHGAPYRGFLSISRSAFVTIRNAGLSGHKTYTTIGSAGLPVSMGTYDFNADRSLHVAMIDCRQLNDMDDARLWGVMGSNYCKALLLDGCALSRFDAHKGVCNATIRRSTIRLVNLIGGGRFLMEDSKVTGASLVNLRSDYGSFWNGDIVIRNSVLAPSGASPQRRLALIVGFNDGHHDFGYPCGMPRRIELDNVRIEDLSVAENVAGPALFGDFKIDPAGGPHPYGLPQEVVLKDIATASGKLLRIGDAPDAFNAVSVARK